MAQNAEVASKTNITTRSAKNLSVLGTWLKIQRLVIMVMEMMMKLSKDHLFPKSQMYLQSISPPYALEKDKFFLIVLTMVEALS